MKISFIFGTRPEAIKLAPVILAMRKDARFFCRVCVTAQHRQMLDQVLDTFEIHPDVDLDLMQPGQSLAVLTTRALEAVDGYLAVETPDMVLVQGDTTTVLCAALAAFYRKVPVGHVEAGLRSWNLQAPWPEEANRTLTARVATLHFAPTELARQNLLKESVPADQIQVTGNTVIDALFLAMDKVQKNPPRVTGLPDHLQPQPHRVVPASPRKASPGGLVLITGHRRENFGKGFESICRAIAELAARFPEVSFVYPVHLNPNVQEPVRRILRMKSDDIRQGGAGPPNNVYLIEPVPYLSFVALMSYASIILTDSGGIQEEALSLGKPVLVMRDTTERPEGLATGWVKLVGTDRERIVSEAARLLDRPSGGIDNDPTTAVDFRCRHPNPYGDGKAAERIVAGCAEYLAKFPGRK